MKRQLPLLMSILVLIASCTSNPKSNAIKISKTNFDEEISSTQNLIFTFNADLAPDSILMNWQEADYLDINPPIEGQYRWNAANTLQFSPTVPLPGATNFEIKLNKNLLKHSETQLPLENSASISFRTIPLRLVSTSVFWNSNQDNGEKQLQAQLSFNTAVDPSAVNKLISFKSGKAKISSKPVTQVSARQVTFLLAHKEEEDDQPLDLEIKAGLKSAGGNLATIESMFFATFIPSPDKLAVRILEANHTGKEGQVRIVFTQAVDPAALKSALKLKPSLDYTVESSNNSLTIKSKEFNLSTNYSLEITKGLKGLLGGKLQDEYEKQFTFGKLQPKIGFTSSKGIYLGGNGSRNIGVEITAIDKVKVEIYKIYENNLLAFGRERRRSRWHYDYEERVGYDYYSYNTTNYGDLIWEKEYQTDGLEKLGEQHLLNIDFSDKAEQFKGTYLVKVKAEDKLWLSDMRMVAVSDIGIIAKATAKQVHVFANSIKTAEALQGVTVNFISRNNQQIGSLETNADGVAIFDVPTDLPEDMRVGLVTASVGTDYNFMLFDKTSVNSSSYEVGGFRANDGGPYDAFLYADRNLYRPGDKAHIAGIVRTTEWGLPGRQPVRIKITGPDGSDWKTVKKSIDDQGAFEMELAFPTTAQTGGYTANLYTSNDVHLSTYRFSVEEFVPDKIKLNVNLSQNEATPGDEFDAELEVLNLYGPPAANRNCEAEFSITRKWFRPKGFEDYEFNMYGNLGFSKKFDKSKSGDDGKSSIEFSIPKSLENQGILSGKILATAFDESGRPVYKSRGLEIFTQKHMLGIGSIPYYIGTKQIIDVPLVALDSEGKVQSGIQAEIQIIKYEYETVLENNNGRFRYRSKKRERVLVEDKITLSGTNTTYAFSPRLSGRYEIRVSNEGADTYVVRSFYSYGRGDTNYSSFEVDNEGEISIVTDKASYSTGENVEVLFKAPFDGKLLVTVERDKVMHHFYKETKNKSASISFDLPGSYQPNIYINATLIRPENNEGLPLTVAHGFHPIEVLDPKRRIPIEIIADEQTRSSRKQTVKLKTKPGANVTLAVVDEGILQITGMKSPDPYAFFFRKRALEVRSFDMYTYLYPELGGGNFVGGDGPGGSLRLNPVEANRFKLLSYWSGIQKADGNGNYSFEFELPKFSGALRVMAVAWEDDNFGAAEKEMKVADPLVVTTSMPRFLSPGDVLTVPVTLANTTKGDVKGSASLSVEGPLEIIGSSKIDFESKAGKESRIIFKLLAKDALGKGVVRLNASALGENFPDEIEIPVRPSAGLQKQTGVLVLKGGESQDVKLNAGFMAGTGSSKLLLSNSPMVEFAEHLEYLVRYPHGCAEQTISKAFPQLYFSELSSAIGRGQDEEIQLSANYNVQQAIAKLEGMMLSSGALAYWPNGYENWWATIYATHFLYEAKQKGHDISQNQLNRMQGYLKNKLNQKEMRKAYMGNGTYKEIAPREVSYAIYVLALMDKADLPTMNYYKARPQILSEDAKYLLATAYALAGDPKRFSDLLPGRFMESDEIPTYYGSFRSQIRDEALALNAVIDADPDHLQIPKMALHLSKQMKAARYLNTQERAFGFMALGKIAQTDNLGDATASITANGKNIGEFSGKNLIIERPLVAGENVVIKSQGQGNVYAFWETKGISSDGSFKEEDSYLKVRRSFFDRNGRSLNFDNIAQNDLIVVKISLTAPSGSTIENIAITDVLPAGFEIENSRLREAPEFDWIADESTADYVDIRDDRINLYCTAYSRTRNYYYSVRAVSPGEFKMGPIMADAMYNGEYHSYNGSRVVSIK